MHVNFYVGASRTNVLNLPCVIVKDEMHRVFKLKNDQLRIIHNLLSSNGIENNFRLTAANNPFSTTSVRNQSTNISPSIKPKKLRKKRIRSTKKYAELLVGKLFTIQGVLVIKITFFL